MKRSIVMQRLLSLLAVLTLGLPMVKAHSKKTFLMPRAVGMNKVTEFRPWNEKLRDYCDEEHALDVRFRGSTFYQHSTNKKEIGEYFGIGNCKNCFTIGTRYDIQNADRPVSAQLINDETFGVPADVDGALMTGFEDAFQAESGPHQFHGTVCFNPDQEVYGTRLEFEYAHNPHQGFFFNAAMPIVSVSNSMNMCIIDDRKVKILEQDAPAFPGYEFTIADYFAGRMSVNAAFDPSDRRDPLTRSKIVCRRKRTGVADLDLTLGYRHHASETYYITGNARLTVPTGNTPKGCYLFEPVVGNGNHVGFGAGLDGGFQAWKSDSCCMWVEAGLQFKYLFEGQEVRMLGVKGFTELPPLAHYMLMSTVHGAPAEGIPLFPAANQLTRGVDVKPGSHLDALLDVSLRMKKFVFDLGYNLYWRADEKVSVRTWENDTYGILHTTLSTSSAVTVEDFIDQKFVNCENLDTCAAETPSQLTHKIHADVAYRSMFCNHPTTFGIGGSYEFASKNSALEQWAVWTKSSISW